MPIRLPEEPAEVQTADVVVVGGGGAGLRAAYEAAVAGADTLLVTKGRITASGATAVGVAPVAGFSVPNGSVDADDSADELYDDIMRAAQGCADPELVRILADEAVTAADDLERLGVTFMRNPDTGELYVTIGDFGSRRRNRRISHHGKPITVALKKRIDEAGVRTLEQSMVLGLLRDDHGVGGVVALTRDGKRVAVRCGAVVFASGGASQLFTWSLAPPDITGDGYALGYRAGAPLANMEFLQCGFGTIRPAKDMIMAWVWRLLPKLLDRNGASVLAGHLPAGVPEERVLDVKGTHYPFTFSDHSRWVEISARKAMIDGRTTDHGGLYLDFTEVDESALPPGSVQAEMWPICKEWLRKKNMDVTRDPLEVGLFGHAVNGGLIISRNGETKVPGLLAIGENATGPYGADRLGGNMLLNCQIFGKRAGRYAAELAKERRDRLKTRPGVDDTTEIPIRARDDAAGPPITDAMGQLKDTMTGNVLIIRDEQSLGNALRDLQRIREEVEGGFYRISSVKEYMRAHEVMNLVEVATMTVEAARLRTESRGSHYREDHPAVNPDLAKPIIIERGADGRHVSFGEFRDHRP